MLILIVAYALHRIHRLDEVWWKFKPDSIIDYALNWVQWLYELLPYLKLDPVAVAFEYLSPQSKK